jgi:K+-sensing histidine kinase KdpD
MFVVLDLCPVYPMLPVSLDCPFLIARSVFSNVCWVRVQCFVVVHGIVFMEYFVLQLLLIWIRKLWMSGTSFSVLFRWSFQFFFISLKFFIIDDKKPFSSKNTTKETMLILKILCSTLTKHCTRTQQTLENTERASKTKYSMKTIPCTTSSLTKRMYLQRRIV